MPPKVVFLSHHQIENQVAFEGLVPHLEPHAEVIFIKLCPENVVEGWHPSQPLPPESQAFYDLKIRLQLHQPYAVVYDSPLQWIITSSLAADLPETRWVCADLSFVSSTPSTTPAEPYVKLHYASQALHSIASAAVVSYPIDRDLQPTANAPPAVVLALSSATLGEEYRVNTPFVDQLLTAFVTASASYSLVKFICVLPSTSPPACAASASSTLFVKGINLADWNVKLLLTDGDNLTFQAALVMRIPILVVPFTSFHQPLAEWVTEHQAGLVIPPTHTLTLADDPLHDPHRSLDVLPAYISELLSWRPAPFPLTPRAFFSPVVTILNRLPLQPGDVILGCRLDRATYFRERHLTLESVGFYETNEPEGIERADPVFIDHYLDLLRYPYRRRHQLRLTTDPLGIRFRPPISDYLRRHRELELTDQHIADACVVVIDALLAQGVCLHFVLDSYAADKSPVTRAELLHIFRYHNQRIDRQIFFYTLHPQLQRLCIYGSEYARSTLRFYLQERLELVQRQELPDLQTYLQTLCSPTIYLQFRVKSVERLLQNLWRDNEYPQPQYFADLFGFRLVTLHTLERHAVYQHLCAHLPGSVVVDPLVGGTHVFRVFSDVEVQVCTQTQMLRLNAPFHKDTGFISTARRDVIDTFSRRLEHVQHQVDTGLV